MTRSPWHRLAGARTGRFARRIVVTSALISLAACGGGGAEDGGDGAARRVVIPSGASFRAATDSLARHGVVATPRLFRLYARLTNRDRTIQAGTYDLRPGQSWGEILDALAAGRGVVVTFTIPEGLALVSIIPVMAEALEVAPESLEVAVRDTALRNRLDVPTETVEGYLFPDTYTFAPGTSARRAVETMVARFEEVWQDAWNERLQAMAMTRHAAVTMASIVEKEARVAEERPVISAVYHNRLRIGMPLQADPTVQYALGRHVERVLYRDLEVDSRYNTYRYPGLPPGPIASPGAASLEAAVHPADVPYLFFVAHPDGHHEFRRTYQEHLEAIRRIRGGGGARSNGGEGRRADGRK